MSSNITANWSYPTAVRLGRGRIKELADACKSLGMKTPLLITDRGLASMAITKNASTFSKTPVSVAPSSPISIRTRTRRTSRPA